MKTALKGQWKAGGIGCAVLIVLLIILLATCSSDEEIVGTGDPKVDGIALYNQVMTTARSCDAAAYEMTEQVQSGDEVAAYRSAEDAAATCLSTGARIGKLGIASSFDEESRAAAKAALEGCADAYTSKWHGLDTFKDAIDEGASPSRLAGIQHDGEYLERGLMLCATRLVSLAIKNGATTKDLGLTE